MKAYLITMICLGAIALTADGKPLSERAKAFGKLIQMGLLGWAIYLLVQL